MIIFRSLLVGLLVNRQKPYLVNRKILSQRAKFDSRSEEQGVCTRSNKGEILNVYKMASLKERYTAAMVLAGVGDALGYKNGEWEFCHSGTEIYKALMKLGGLKGIKIKLPGWMVSDDTVMMLASAEALCESSGDADREKLFLKLAEKYKECMNDMTGRAPGNTCMFSTHKLNPRISKGYQIQFNDRGGGCGAAMRSTCIGLRYPRPSDLSDLVAVSVEAGRMTHHNPTGYLGSLASALFTALALQGRPLREWGRCLLDTLPMAKAYIQSTGHAVKENEQHWAYFEDAWTKYLTQRNILDGKSDPLFPEPFGFPERDAFYKSVSFGGWGGASGHDAPMIAYDALMGSNWNWDELCKRAIFHGGDSDSTGIIAACCYGARMGFHDVPEGNHKRLEYRDRLVDLADKLLKLSHPETEANTAKLLKLSHPDTEASTTDADATATTADAESTATAAAADVDVTATTTATAATTTADADVAATTTDGVGKGDL